MASKIVGMEGVAVWMKPTSPLALILTFNYLKGIPRSEIRVWYPHRWPVIPPIIYPIGYAWWRSLHRISTVE